MNNTTEIRKTLNNVREQLLALETDIRNSQQIAFSQHGEEEIRTRLNTVRKQVLELEQKIQKHQKTASSGYDDSQITLQPGLSLTADQLSVASAIVQQASRRIHDLRQLSAAEYSDTEVEAASRSFVHQGRKSYLDAIQAIRQ